MAHTDDVLVLIAPGFREQRRAARKRVHVPAVLRSSTVGRINGVITDISILGCQMRVVQHLVKGTYLLVQVPTFEPFGARVVWAEDGLVGFEFTHPLHQAVVDHIIDMSTLERKPH